MTGGQVFLAIEPAFNDIGVVFDAAIVEGGVAVGSERLAFS
jgi:hypothetical protein